MRYVLNVHWCSVYRICKSMEISLYPSFSFENTTFFGFFPLALFFVPKMLQSSPFFRRIIILIIWVVSLEVYFGSLVKKVYKCIHYTIRCTYIEAREFYPLYTLFPNPDFRLKKSKLAFKNSTLNFKTKNGILEQCVVMIMKVEEL